MKIDRRPFKATEAAFGTCDLLVNNAGKVDPRPTPTPRLLRGTTCSPSTRSAFLAYAALFQG